MMIIKHDRLMGKTKYYIKSVSVLTAKFILDQWQSFLLLLLLCLLGQPDQGSHYDLKTLGITHTMTEHHISDKLNLQS